MELFQELISRGNIELDYIVNLVNTNNFSAIKRKYCYNFYQKILQYFLNPEEAIKIEAQRILSKVGALKEIKNQALLDGKQSSDLFLKESADNFLKTLTTIEEASNAISKI